MKKTLFSFCALVLCLSASAQLVETPKGKLIDHMYRSSSSWVKKGWIGTEPGRYDGLVSKVVVGEDGCLYVYNPVSGFDSKSWLKLDPLSAGKYRAKLPQVIFKDNNGGDDDDEGANTERKFLLNRMIIKDNNQYEVVSKDNNFMDFSWDGQTLKMLGVGNKNEILGIVYDNGSWENRYGDWDVTIESFENTPVTPPANAKTVQYTLSSKEETSPRVIDAAIDGNDIYLKGISKTSKLANVWVKLTQNGNTAEMLTNQYLGTTVRTDFVRFSNDASVYHTYAAAYSDASTLASKLTFSVNAETGVLTCNNVLKIVFGKRSTENASVDGMETFESLVLIPFVKKAAKPAAPTLHYRSAVDSYDYSLTTITLAFYVRNVDESGNYLDPNNMYYNVYINDNPQPFKFLKSQYYYLEKDMVDIPFNYQDKRNEDFKVSDDQRILHFYDAHIKKLTVVMVYEQDGKKYQSEPMSTNVVTSGIDKVATDNKVVVGYYAVDGSKRQQLEKGVNVVKYSDGSSKKIIVK